MGASCRHTEFHSAPSLQDLGTSCNQKTLADGRVQVSGNGDLKASQTYPPAFGHATVGVWKMAVRRQLPPVNKLPNIWKGKVDKWADADLSDVFQFLSMGTMK